MKSLTIHTLAMAVAVMLSGTPSLAVDVSSLPVDPTEQTDRHSVTAATSTVPLYALNRLDASTLAEQEMTDQELKAVEGGIIAVLIGGSGDGRLDGLTGIYYDFARGFYNTCGC